MKAQILTKMPSDRLIKWYLANRQAAVWFGRTQVGLYCLFLLGLKAGFSRTGWTWTVVAEAGWSVTAAHWLILHGAKTDFSRADVLGVRHQLCRFFNRQKRLLYPVGALAIVSAVMCLGLMLLAIAGAPRPNTGGWLGVCVFALMSLIPASLLIVGVGEVLRQWLPSSVVVLKAAPPQEKTFLTLRDRKILDAFERYEAPNDSSGYVPATALSTDEEAVLAKLEAGLKQPGADPN